MPPALAPHYLAELMHLASRLEVQVRVERLGDAEIEVTSGLVWLEGRPIVFLDARLSPREKVLVLARELSSFPLEGIYLKPAIRRLLRPAEEE
ncbi:MAG: hypothetical protein JSV00_10480 [bacterium]|nr:MAG: hypothetical protein JSV00_10480 [bacterium]